jgi:hypothetical protein
MFERRTALAIIIYLLIILIIYLTNITNDYSKDKQILFYFILSSIIPILIFIFTILL